MRRFILNTLATTALIASLSTPGFVQAQIEIISPSLMVIPWIHKIQQGDFRGAIEILNAAIKANPNDSQTYHNRSFCYFQLHIKLNGESQEVAKKSEYLDKALIDAEQAIKLDPNNFFAWVNRGNVRTLRGDLRDGISDYTKAYIIIPLPTIVFSRGRALARLGDKKAALADFEEAAAQFKAQGRTALYQATLDEIKQLR